MKKTKSRKPSTLKKSNSKKLDKQVESDLEEVELTLPQNIIDQINNLSQKKQIRLTISPSGINVPLEQILGNGSEPNIQFTNNNTNNLQTNTDNKTGTEIPRKAPPPLPNPRKLQDIPQEGENGETEKKSATNSFSS